MKCEFLLFDFCFYFFLSFSSFLCIKCVTNFNDLKSIQIKENECFDERCYTNLTDVYNSPLVECSYL